jgi:hypothetical protein
MADHRAITALSSLLHLLALAPWMPFRVRIRIAPNSFFYRQIHNRNKGFVRSDESAQSNHAHLFFSYFGSWAGEHFPFVLFPAHSFGNSFSAKCCESCSRRIFGYRKGPRLFQPVPYRFGRCIPRPTHVWHVNGPVSLVRNNLKRRNITFPGLKLSDCYKNANGGKL